MHAWGAQGRKGVSHNEEDIYPQPSLSPKASPSVLELRCLDPINQACTGGA